MRKLLLILILTVLTLPAAMADGGCEGASRYQWISQVIKNGFNIHDSTICYPRFPRFCLKVYDWGDRTFNSYDTTYVVGTGKNWKLMGKSYNWMEATTLLFPEDKRLDMHTNLYSDAGARLSFMAVSVGYMWNINKLINSPSTRHTFDLSFTTSRFTLSYQTLSNEGGMVITKFGDYAKGQKLRYHFNNVRLTSKNAEAFYFFRHRKYSHAAAYSYSKYQLKSAGTWVAGFSFTEQRMHMNFSDLPQDMLEYLPLESPVYNSHYESYSLLGGYSYNWVLHPRRWMINAYSTVAMGYRRVFGTKRENLMRSLIANNINISVAAVYNHRALFAAGTLKAMGYINYNSNYYHVNFYPSITAVVGMRF